MPRLADNLATQAKNADTGGGGAVPAGTYRARLEKVEAKQSKNNKPMWVWVYKIVEPEKYAGRTIWNNTTIQENTMWTLAQSFAAFGVPTDTDTEDLIGCTVSLEVTERIIEGGTRAGSKGNNVDRVNPDDSDDAVRPMVAASAPAAASGGKKAAPSPDEY